MSAGGRYKIHYRLSEVGKPLVFLAQDLETEQQVVVRPVSANQVPPRDVLMAIEHPNICKVLDLVETPGSLLMVTEFVSGLSLRQFQRDSYRMGRSLGWVLDTAIALAFLQAHQPVVLCRNLNPNNVIVNPKTNRAILLDVAICKPSSTVTLQDDFAAWARIISLLSTGEEDASDDLIPPYLLPLLQRIQTAYYSTVAQAVEDTGTLIVASRKEDFDCVAQWIDYAEALACRGKHEKALQALQRVQEEAPQDPRIRKALLDLGDYQRDYPRLLQMLIEEPSNDPQEILELYERVVIEGSHPDLIQQVYDRILPREVTEIGRRKVRGD